MVNICQTCGEPGFANSLIYCTECWDTAEHIYCLGLSPRDIRGDFSWTCDSCAVKHSQKAAVVMFGDQIDPLPVSEKCFSGVPVVGPVWRGEIEIVGSFFGKVDGLEAFIPKTSSSKVFQLKQSLQSSVCFKMKNRHVLWPKQFDELGAGHHDIGLFMFPDISRSEIEYDNLVEHMLSNDLAMTALIGNLKLIIFTSLEQELNQQQIQGKYYLWGIIKGKGFQRFGSSKCKRTNVAKRSNNRLIRALDCPKKSNIHPDNLLSGRCAAQSVEPKKIRTTPSHVECDFLPPLSQGCKRARSRGRRMVTKLNKEVDIGKTIIADLPGSSLPTLTENATIGDDAKESEEHSWNSDMEIDEPSGSLGINVEEPEVEYPNWDYDMEIDEPSEVDAAKDCIESQPQSNVSQETNLAVETCLIPLPYSKELPVPEDSNVVVILKKGPCPDENPVRILSHTVNASNQINVENMIMRLNEGSPGRKELESQEANASDHEEINSCLDEKSPGTNSDNVVSDHHNILEDTIPGISEVSAGLTVIAPLVTTDPNNCSRLHLICYHEQSDVPEANLPVGQNKSYVDENSLEIKSNSLAADYQSVIQEQQTVLPISDSSIGLTVTAPIVTTDPNNCSRLNLLCYQEQSDVPEADPPVGKNESYVDVESLGTKSNSVATDYQTIIQEQQTVLPISNSSIGLCQLVSRKDQPQCQASDLPDLDSCRTPVLAFEEKPPPSSSSNAAARLELDDDEKEETTLKVTQIFDEGTDIITSTSVHRASDFQDTTLDIPLVQVGRYMTRYDLAPILTKVLKTYGDIALGCSMMPELLLMEICKALQDLETVSFSGLRSHHIDHLKNLGQVGKALGIDVKWLSKRCEDLERTALQLTQYIPLKRERSRCNEAVKLLKEKVNVKRDIVAQLLDENRLMEEELELLAERQEKMHFEFEYVRSESSRFLGKSLVDGII